MVKRKPRSKPRTPRQLNRLKKKISRRNKFNTSLIVAVVGVLLVFLVGSVMFLSYLQEISQDLPTPEKPFGKKNTTSIIYDRNGRILYRVFDEEDRDPVDIKTVPARVKWTYLAAEDLNYYNHPGVDLFAMLRCGYRVVSGSGDTCGGSTITQQLIKKTALTDEVNFDRKLREIILALKIERERSKDEILEMYFRVVPEGSNIYGITRGAKFYFNKTLDQLNLAEIAVLASIPQNPSRLSPTKSLSPELAEGMLNDRKNYVLDQLQKHKDWINTQIKAETNDEKQLLTDESIAEARTAVLKYQDPIFQIKAPHFVFYVEQLLQERGYNNGKPFTLSEIETEGLRIYTTLDYSYQKIAEQQVKKGVEVYGARYGARNASLVALNPKNGEVLAYVGSYNYFGRKQPQKCRVGLNCEFEPQVNIPVTLQSYGSSMKPMIYYSAIMSGLITPGTTMEDIPIKIGGYQPKNYEGGFFGKQSATWMLVNSRNIPAIMLTDLMGTSNVIKELKKWGYTSFGKSSNYGPSVAVGGGDVKLIEHAQAYAIFANEGKFTQHEVITKIEDSKGNVIYQYKPKSKRVADPRGVFLVNTMLNGRNGGPGYSFDGRDISGKTGTSEGQKETLFVTYTPEIVVAGWLGNNNNKGMYFGATGSTSAKPWVSEFIQRLGDKIPATTFARPEGIYYSSSRGWGISGIYAPGYLGVPPQYRLIPIVKEQDLNE